MIFSNWVNTLLDDNVWSMLEPDFASQFPGSLLENEE